MQTICWMWFTVKWHLKKPFSHQMFQRYAPEQKVDLTVFLLNKLQNYLWFFHSIDNTYTFAQPNHSKENAAYWTSLTSHNKAHDFNCISDIFKHLEHNYGDEAISILVTGSLHLVGEVLRTIKGESVNEQWRNIFFTFSLKVLNLCVNNFV